MKNYYNFPKTELTEIEKLSVYLQVAIKSNNPTIISALDDLILLISIAEGEKISDTKKYCAVADLIKRDINKKDVDKIIDFALENRDLNTLAALENFIDVATLQFQQN
jgi:accessory colonization factor AcfC